MIVLAVLFWALYLGTPLFIIGWWIRRPKPVWPMLTALGLWLLQFAVWVVIVGGCLGGHCRLTALQEYGPYVLTVLAYAAIAWLLKVTSSPGRSGRKLRPRG